MTREHALIHDRESICQTDLCDYLVDYDAGLPIDTIVADHKDTYTELEIYKGILANCATVCDDKPNFEISYRGGTMYVTDVTFKQD